MLSRTKRLALLFTAAIGLPFVAISSLSRLELQDRNDQREAVVSKAEAFAMATERLYNRNAISTETYDQRKGYFAACLDADAQYGEAIKSGDRQRMNIEREVFRETCTMPVPKI